ncbi:MAG: hypothetical protein KKE73_13015 [Proteobacteria bacterium]|nr:hypothetical protein [Pseudomonadota bacterium]
MIQSVQAGYPTQAIEPAQTQKKNISASQPAQSGDSANFSDAGRLMSSFFADLGVDYTPGKAITLDDFEAGLKRSRDKLQSDVGALFIENGISTTPPVELTSDGEGHIRVKGDHPQKDQIEQLFAERPDLANDFRKVSGLDSMVEAGKEYLDFAAAYAKDPYAAVAQYSHLFNGLESDSFSLLFGGEEEQVEA